MMNELIIKITSGEYYNITFDNDEYYTLSLKDGDYQLLENISDPTDAHLRRNTLGDIEIYARFIGNGRTHDWHQRCPLFAIDLESEIRKNKIEKIIEDDAASPLSK